MQVRCLCPCHSEHRADQREANQAGRFMEAYHHAQAASVAEYKGLGVSVTDPVEAAAACADCLNTHCPALSSKAPAWPPNHPRDAAVQSEQRQSAGQQT